MKCPKCGADFSKVDIVSVDMIYAATILTKHICEQCGNLYYVKHTCMPIDGGKIMPNDKAESWIEHGFYKVVRNGL